MARYKISDVAPIKQGIVKTSEKYWLLNLDMVESNTGKIKNYLYVEPDKIGSSTVAFDVDNVLYSKLRPYLNKVVLPTQPGYATSEMLPLCPVANIITREYLTYFLRSPRFVAFINEKTSGAKMPRVNIPDLLAVEVECPSLERQKVITKVFDKLTFITSFHQQQLQKLDALVKARFVEMFGDVSTGIYKFETYRLGEVASVGSSHRVFTTEFVEEGIPFYRGTEIGELASGQKPSNPFYISEEHYKRLTCNDTKPQVGDLLMPSICNKGQIWMVDNEEPFYYKDGRVLCISANRDIYDTRYLLYYMRLKTEIEYPKLGSGSTFAEFKIFLLKDIEVLTPSRVLQQEFAEFATQVDKTKTAIQTSLNKTQELYDALMQEYFG